MSRFILLHASAGSRPIWVNMNHVASMQQTDEGTWLFFDTGSVKVTEDVTAIFDAMRNAERSAQ